MQDLAPSEPSFDRAAQLPAPLAAGDRRHAGDEAKPARAAARLAALDSLRGLIMVIMALDHASGFIARVHGSEFWTGPWTRYSPTDFVRGPLAFLSRFITHLCAPGFFFLMGASMTLFAASRRRLGWDTARITRYFALRGGVLLLVNQLLENPAWGLAFSRNAKSGDGPSNYLFFTVITGLGLSMLAGGLLLRAERYVAAIAAVLLLGCAALIPSLPYDFFAAPVWLRVLLLPGNSTPVFLLYPLFPWLGICTLGMAFGRLLAEEATRDKALRWVPLVGLLLVGVALGLRAGGGFGNLRPPRDATWIEFLNFIKYPPALVFALFMVGVNAILLGLFARLGAVPILSVFGQAPLCFYLAHLYLYALITVVFYGQPSTLPGMYPVWLAGLVPLYFLCRWYRGFKDSKPAESLWRLF
jgi:uncharacterized membrane protein